MKPSELFTYFTDTIFRRDIAEWRNPAVRWLVRQYKLLFYTARGLQGHGTIVRSAALTFYTLMSLHSRSSRCRWCRSSRWSSPSSRDSASPTG